MPADKITKELAKELAKTGLTIKERTLALILAALGLVAALAWNDAIKSLFETLLPKGQALVGKIIYAILVTTIAVAISYWLNKLLEEKENK